MINDDNYEVGVATGVKVGVMVGVIAGVALVILIQGISGNLPSQERRKVYQQAVEHGYGKWVMETNDTLHQNPTTIFEWIKK